MFEGFVAPCAAQLDRARGAYASHVRSVQEQAEEYREVTARLDAIRKDLREPAGNDATAGNTAKVNGERM